MNALPPGNNLRVLIIKLRYIGDTILTTPLVRAVKRDPRIGSVDLLVPEESAPLIRDCPHIDTVIALPPEGRRSLSFWVGMLARLRSARYQVVMDLTGSDRSSLFCFITGAPVRLGYSGSHRFRQWAAYTMAVPSALGSIHAVDHHLKMAEALEISIDDHHPCLPVTSEASDVVEQILQEAGIAPGSPFAVIHPGARRWYKSWPKDRFTRLADQIMATLGMDIVLAGGPGDGETCRDISAEMYRKPVNLCGRLPLARFPALVQKAACLIGNDSAPIHVATAVGTPVIGLFGPTRPEAWAPRRDRDRVIAAAFPCRSCGHSRKDCPLGEEYCMGTISYETVWDAVRGLLVLGGAATVAAPEAYQKPMIDRR